MSKDKFLLVKGRAGLGNRILSAMTGILYARLSGRRLIIDWSDFTYSNGGSNVFHSFFTCQSCKPNDQIPDTYSVSPSVWHGHLHERVIDIDRRYKVAHSAESRRISSIDLSRLDYQEDVVVMWTFFDEVELLRSHFKGPFKELAEASRKEILSKILREDLILHPQIRERVDRFKDTTLSKKTVGVHVRHTDYKANLSSILNKLDMLLKQKPELQFFLATDDIGIRDMFEASYPNVTSTPHWYGVPGSHIHQNPDCPDRMVNGIEALVDLYLLTECEYLIVDTSSIFSYVALLLTKATQSKIFNVNPGERGEKKLRRRLWLSSRIVTKLGAYTMYIKRLRRLLSL